MEQQKQSTPSIGHLMKAARKFRKFNQLDVARAIGCSQSALSKMEHGLLTPSAPQWFLFSRFTAIPPESIETGYINRNIEAKLNNDEVSLGYKLPRRYRQNRAVNVRQIYPFLTFFEKKLGEVHMLYFLKEAGLEREFFYDLDNLISYQLVVDCVNHLIKNGLSSEELIREVVASGQDGIYWDTVIDNSSISVNDVLIDFSNKQNLFQKDFNMKVSFEHVNPIVTFFPEQHVYQFLKDLRDDTKAFIATYRKLTLENIIKIKTGVSVEAKDLGEVNSPLTHRFEIIKLQ